MSAAAAAAASRAGQPHWQKTSYTRRPAKAAGAARRQKSTGWIVFAVLSAAIGLGMGGEQIWQIHQYETHHVTVEAHGGGGHHK